MVENERKDDNTGDSGGKSPKKLRVLLRTFGCQMNDHDSARVRDLLVQKGYSAADSPETADVILFNTCSVRQHAEERVFGQVWDIKKLKDKRPGLIIGIIGCMAEARKDGIFKRVPHVDFLCGPSFLDKVPEIIEEVKTGAAHIVYTGSFEAKTIPSFSMDRAEVDKAFVKIMEGCDNFCSYCVVPFVRGPERSRPSAEIAEEIKGLVEKGVKKITLLGQNVNSYGKGLDEKITFPGLLRKITGRIGDEKVLLDFVSSHPKDAGTELFEAMAELKSLSKNLHLALQSGSDKILERMNRGYTIAEYKKLVNEFREIVKNSRLVTDLIVGFPGETEDDFRETLDAVKEIGFDAAYIFKYSPRPFTAAAKFEDDVPKEEKERRHALLLETQKRISKNKKRTP
jgi:tRNA-2-methylthio-N6-dimethylallyladenosine synthase